MGKLLRNNGHKKANRNNRAGEGFGLGINDPNFFDDTFEGLDFGNYSKDLIEPGEDVSKLLMRTVLANTTPPELKTIVRCQSRYEKFHQDRHKAMLINLMAGSVSIMGRSRLELLMAKTNIVAANVLEKLISGYSIGPSSGKKSHGPKKKEYVPAEQDEGEDEQ